MADSLRTIFIKYIPLNASFYILLQISLMCFPVGLIDDNVASVQVMVRAEQANMT